MWFTAPPQGFLGGGVFLFSREMHFKTAARRGCDAGLYPLVGRHRGSEGHHRGLGAGAGFGLTQTEWFTALPQGFLVGGVLLFLREMHCKTAARRGCHAGLYPLVGRHRGSERHHRGLGAGAGFGLTQTEWFTAPPQGFLVGGVFLFLREIHFNTATRRGCHAGLHPHIQVSSTFRQKESSC